MCFSATASFSASALLLLCSIVTLKKATKAQRMFAAIPLIFAIQQFLEGRVWQSITAGFDPLSYAYGFLAFVFLVWPIWIPLSIIQMAPSAQEKKRLRFPLIAGIVIALITLAYLGIKTPSVLIACGHLRYTAAINPMLWIPGSILYLIATITPFFMVSIPRMAVMGTILALSYGVSFWFYFQNILSVWCFFAAILSAFILLIIG